MATENKKQAQMLLINDMAGYGKVTLSVMIPVLSYLKFETFNLPTALVSNTLEYGRFDIWDITEYKENWAYANCGAFCCEHYKAAQE